MANERLDRFTKLLKEIFELDKSDLDFGIYRVMNLRKTQIEEFLTQRLPQMVQETLAPFAQGSKEEIRAQMTQIEENVASMGMTVDALPDNAPMKQKYITLQKALAEGADLAALETDVYSALYSFFNRYYEDGDFISKRRYKEGVYAIPYEGEEVKLYWANQDQYYIKTSENFKDYTFVFDGITVHFRLVDATTEQNNNKESKTVFCYICGTKFADEQKKIAQSNTITPQNKQSVIPSEDHNDAIAPLLQRISLFLEDEEFDRADEYCERVLDMDPTNAEAYFDKILVEYQCSSAECLKSCMFEISSSKNYAKIMRFGNERQKNTVLSINEEIQRSIRAAEKEAVEDDESRCYDDVASNNEEYYVDIYCPFCNAELSYTNWQIEEGKIVCPECDMQFEYSEGLRRQ